MMSADPPADGEFEGDIGVMRRLVRAVDERRPGRAAARILAMAPGTREVERAPSQVSGDEQQRARPVEDGVSLSSENVRPTEG
jgi:hypothetical protein